MSEEYRNIYQNARKSAGLTQEAAAERLGISTESVRAYETGVRVPPNDVVEQMVICYNTQHLAYQHLHETNALAARIVPALEQRSLLEVAVRIYNRIFPFKNGVNYLGFHTYITADGKSIRRLKNQSKRNAQKKFVRMAKLVAAGKLPEEKFFASYNAWKNHISHGNCYGLGEIMDKRIGEILKL